MANARVDRTAVSGNNEQEIYAPARIMGQSQMNELQTWMRTPKVGLSLLVSSVPVLLPPAIGLAEYIAGKRFWQESIAPLKWLGVRLARWQQKVALRTSFDHWPTYSATWQEFVRAFDECEQDMLVLSGDVHFSYAMEAHRRRKKRIHLYQFVSTPLQNVLSTKDQQLIERQAGITHLRLWRTPNADASSLCGRPEGTHTPRYFISKYACPCESRDKGRGWIYCAARVHGEQ